MTLIKSFSLPGVNKHYKFTGGSGREHDLMQAVGMLLEKLNAGQVTLTPDMMDNMQKGGSGTSTFREGQINIHGDNDLLRRQNAERMNLERELVREEQNTLGNQVQEDVDKRQKIINHYAEDLAFKLQGICEMFSPLEARGYCHCLNGLHAVQERESAVRETA